MCGKVVEIEKNLSEFTQIFIRIGSFVKYLA